MDAKECSLPLTQENIARLTLDDILRPLGNGSSGEGCLKRPDGERINDLVRVHLQSKYLVRRAYALKALADEMLVRDIEVGELAAGEIVSTYLRINRKTQWMLVGRYRRSDPFVEQEPTAEDRNAWAEYLGK